LTFKDETSYKLAKSYKSFTARALKERNIFQHKAEVNRSSLTCEIAHVVNKG
jgi:hypothetical protein